MLGTRQRRAEEPTLQRAVEEELRTGAAKPAPEASADGLFAGEVPRFRASTSEEIRTAAANLARRLRRGADPTEDEFNAALVLIMDAEDQRKALHELRFGQFRTRRGGAR